MDISYHKNQMEKFIDFVINLRVRMRNLEFEKQDYK